MSDHALIVVVLGLNVVNVAAALVRTALQIEKRRSARRRDEAKR